MNSLERVTSMDDASMSFLRFRDQANMLSLARLAAAGGLPTTDIFRSGYDVGRLVPYALAFEEKHARNSEQQILAEDILSSLQKRPLSMREENVEAANVLSLSNFSQKNVKKSTRPKKPKDMPKRPLSAYNIFFKEERTNILNAIPCPQGEQGQAEERSHCDRTVSSSEGTKASRNENLTKKQRLPHGKIGFENLAKTIGQRWKYVSKEQKKYYQALADNDTDRYKREMEAYRQTQAEKRKAEENEAELQKTKFDAQKNDRKQISNNDNEDLIRKVQSKLEVQQDAPRKRKVSPNLDTEGSAPTHTGAFGVTSEPFARSYLKRMKVSPSIEKRMSEIAAQEEALSHPLGSLAVTAAALHANLAAQQQSDLLSPAMLDPSFGVMNGSRCLPSRRNDDRLRELIRQMSAGPYNPYA